MVLRGRVSHIELVEGEGVYFGSDIDANFFYFGIGGKFSTLLASRGT